MNQKSPKRGGGGVGGLKCAGDCHIGYTQLNVCRKQNLRFTAVLGDFHGVLVGFLGGQRDERASQADGEKSEVI